MSPKQGDNILPTEEGETCIRGALTMGEGVSQKLWTIITGCIELLPLEDLGFDSGILGQGDNGVLLSLLLLMRQ